MIQRVRLQPRFVSIDDLRRNGVEQNGGYIENYMNPRLYEMYPRTSSELVVYPSPPCQHLSQIFD